MEAVIPDFLKNSKKIGVASVHDTAVIMNLDAQHLAEVGNDGTITAKGTGTCYIYVYAQNGYAKRIKVTV